MSGRTSRHELVSPTTCSGTERRRVKFNLGRYLEAITASNNDLDMNPITRMVDELDTRVDRRGQRLRAGLRSHEPGTERRVRAARQPEPGAASVHQKLRPRLRRRLGQPGVQLVDGSVGVQHEVVPRVSATVAYNRNWWGNWYVVDNRATNFADYTPFSIAAPLDPRLPGGGGQTISGLYNLVPTKVGQVDELAQSYENFGDQIENWQGIDVSVTARLQNGLTVQGGTSTGRRLADGCAVRDKLPELGSNDTGILTNSSVTANVNALGGGPFALSVRNPYCRIAEPYRTDFRGLASYLVPESGRAGVRDMGEHPR